MGEYAFTFDGRSWPCRDRLPADLLDDLALMASRPRTRRGRRGRRGRRIGVSLMTRFLQAAVIDSEGLGRRILDDPQAQQRLYFEVVPALLDHYQTTQRAAD